MVVAQREHQEKLHLLYRHFADDSSGPSSSSSTSLEGYLRAQNKSLKQRLTELETRLLEYTGKLSILKYDHIYINTTNYEDLVLLNFSINFVCVCLDLKSLIIVSTIKTNKKLKKSKFLNILIAYTLT